MNEAALGAFNTSSQIKFKIAMLTSSVCDHNDSDILLNQTITVVGQGANAAAKAANRNHKQVIFKNCALFTITPK